MAMHGSSQLPGIGNSAIPLLAWLYVFVVLIVVKYLLRKTSENTMSVVEQCQKNGLPLRSPSGQRDFIFTGENHIKQYQCSLVKVQSDREECS